MCERGKQVSYFDNSMI